MIVEQDYATWKAVVAAEPQVEQLKLDALQRAREAETASERLWIFHNEFKPFLSQLVGWMRQTYHPLLSSPGAYDVVYREIAKCLRLD